MTYLRPTLTLLSILCAPAFLSASIESKAACSSLPVAVLDAAKTAAPNATVRNCVQEKEHGKMQYEVETEDAGRSRDMTFDSAGRLAAMEQEIPRSALPAAVSNALTKAANGGEVGKVESVTKNGTVQSYETVVLRQGKRHEVAFRPDGTAVRPD